MTVSLDVNVPKASKSEEIHIWRISLNCGDWNEENNQKTITLIVRSNKQYSVPAFKTSVAVSSILIATFLLKTKEFLISVNLVNFGNLNSDIHNFQRGEVILGRCIYLTKAIIRNFKSIESLHLNNIGDVTVLIGPNESGKSNILSALNWFGTDGPLSYEDKPVGKNIDEDEIIVELFFKIINKEDFKEQLVSKVNKELTSIFGGEDIVKINNLNINFELFKLQKRADGSFIGVVFDTELQELNKAISRQISEELQKNFNFAAIFTRTLEENLKTILSANNVPKDQIPSELSRIMQNPNFSSHLNSITEKISSIESETENNKVSKLISKLNAKIQPMLNSIPNNNITFNISGRNIGLNPRSFFTQAYNQTKAKIENLLEIDYEEILQEALASLRPNFVYLSEEMELKGSIEKINNWSNTLREDNEEYAVNSRFFSVLGINLDEFDKMDLRMQDLELENRLIDFSNKLEKLWRQLRVRIRHNITPDEITLKVVEVDEDGRPIKATAPESRSRGFRWYLAYVITLEYLSKKENTILLLDDPAVFLHERGQKDFLKTIEDISENIQVMYSTHLISLFNEKKLDRVLLVELEEGNKTKVKKPWSNKIENVAAPVYHALGFDKLIFEDINKVLFVEGVSDKFIFEGLQKIDKKLSKWYIHPISGGDKIEDNDIISKIKLLECLTSHTGIDYKFVLDGDRKPIIGEKKDENKEIRGSIIFLGDETQELEDLIDKDFYLECVIDTYQGIFMNEPHKLKNVKIIVENMKKQTIKSKITKELDEEFQKNELGSFSKVYVAITIKRRLEKGEAKKEYFNKLIAALLEGLKKG